jgi:predicted RNase H-like nuclease (RuvC/YqgF family)
MINPSEANILAGFIATKDDEILSLRAEIERLREQVASLQASSGYEASIAQVEIERLKAALRECASYGGNVHEIVRRALEGKS